MQNIIGPNTGSRKLGMVERYGKYHWVVFSMNPARYDEGANYHVVFNPRIRKFTCNCPAYLFQNKDFTPCKHIKAVAKVIKEGGDKK